MIKKRVFQKITWKILFWRLSGSFVFKNCALPVSSFYKDCNSTLVLTLDQSGLKFFSKKIMEVAFNVRSEKFRNESVGIMMPHKERLKW